MPRMNLEMRDDRLDSAQLLEHVVDGEDPHDQALDIGTELSGTLRPSPAAALAQIAPILGQVLVPPRTGALKTKAEVRQIESTF